MNEQRQTSDDHQWSDDLLAVLSLTDIAFVLYGPDPDGFYANPAATLLAQALQQPSASDDRVAVDRLLNLIPDGAWETARQDQRWQGEVVVEPTATVLEIKLFVASGNTRERFATFADVTFRSTRGRELQRRHDELECTYQRLAGTRQQLLQSEKMASIGQLAAGVAHEINNPVGYIQSNLATLQDYVSALFAMLADYSEAVECSDAATRAALDLKRERLDIDFITGDLPQLLEESREGIDRVTKIVQDLKDFSRIGPDEPMRPSDLEKGLESTLNIVWNDLKYKVRVEKHYSSLPLVECHASEVNQVLMNLLINAGQSIQERGTIALATGADEGEAWISITDSGCGMPREVVQRIFEPFYTTKPIGHGTGLGLALCYSIIAKHHGRIEVSSRLGTGSTFRVVLPVSQPVLDD